MIFCMDNYRCSSAHCTYQRFVHAIFHSFNYYTYRKITKFATKLTSIYSTLPITARFANVTMTSWDIIYNSVSKKMMNASTTMTIEIRSYLWQWHVKLFSLYSTYAKLNRTPCSVYSRIEIQAFRNGWSIAIRPSFAAFVLLLHPILTTYN